MNPEAYPLQWPAGWPRTKNRQRASFRMTPGAITDHLFDELDRLGATGIVISTNRAPYSRSKAQPEDPGVAVYFTLKEHQQCIPCDKWDRTEDNIHAVGLAVQALRGLERWGTGDMVSAAFQGFKALPGGEARGSDVARSWHTILGVAPDADKEEIKSAFRKLAQAHHPDVGGDAALFQELTNAYAEGMKL